MTQLRVTARADILPHDLPEPVAGHRVDYWTWVENHRRQTSMR